METCTRNKIKTLFVTGIGISNGKAPKRLISKMSKNTFWPTEGVPLCLLIVQKLIGRNVVQVCRATDDSMLGLHFKNEMLSLHLKNEMLGLHHIWAWLEVILTSKSYLAWTQGEVLKCVRPTYFPVCPYLTSSGTRPWTGTTPRRRCRPWHRRLRVVKLTKVKLE